MKLFRPAIEKDFVCKHWRHWLTKFDRTCIRIIAQPVSNQARTNIYVFSTSFCDTWSVRRRDPLSYKCICMSQIPGRVLRSLKRNQMMVLLFGLTFTAPNKINSATGALMDFSQRKANTSTINQIDVRFWVWKYSIQLIWNLLSLMQWSIGWKTLVFICKLAIHRGSICTDMLECSLCQLTWL